MNDWQKVIHSIDDTDAFIGELDRDGLLIMITTMTEIVRSDLAFYMYSWNEAGDDFGTTFEEQHKCGMAACLGGWVAIHPDFKAIGGKQGMSGMPQLNGEDGEAAINELMGLHYEHDLGNSLTEPHSPLYYDLREYEGIDPTIRATDVLERLAYIFKINDAAQQAA